jgi:hypothetical protein
MPLKLLGEYLNQGISNKVVVATSVPTAGGIVVKTQYYPEFLTTHGFYNLPYAEWMKVVGTVWILILIFKAIFPPIKSLFVFLKSKLFKS